MEGTADPDRTASALRRLRLLTAITVAMQCGFLGAPIVLLNFSTGGIVRTGGSALLIIFILLAFAVTVHLFRTLTRSVASRSDAESALREQISAAAVARERERFARDMHDLVGHGVSTIVLKGEMAYRAAATDPATARGALHEIVQLARKALTDIREISRSNRGLSLETELDSVVSTLTGLGIEVTADISHDDLTSDTSTVLAIVLREGTTNLLRHGRGRRCEIRTRTLNGTVIMILTNDCGPGDCPDLADGGSGLENLAARVAAVGGRFQAARSGDRFILGVEIPQDAFTRAGSDEPPGFLGHPERVDQVAGVELGDDGGQVVADRSHREREGRCDLRRSRA